MLKVSHFNRGCFSLGGWRNEFFKDLMPKGKMLHRTIATIHIALNGIDSPKLQLTTLNQLLALHIQSFCRYIHVSV